METPKLWGCTGEIYKQVKKVYLRNIKGNNTFLKNIEWGFI